MDNRALKIALAVAAGTITGAMVGLSFDHMIGRIVWINSIIGATVGGLLAYVSYDIRIFMHAIPKAWSSTIDAVGWLQMPTTKKRFRCALLLIPLATCTGLIVGITFVTVLWMLPLAGGYRSVPEHEMVITSIVYSVFIIFAATFGLNLFSIGTISSSPTKYSEGDKVVSEENHIQNEYAHTKEMLRYILFYLNPIAVYIYWPALGFYKAAPIVCKVLCTFAASLFKAVHSDARLVCLCNAAIFATTAYLLADPVTTLVCALAGAAFGIASFEIISKRWLKLVPAK